MRVDDDVVRLYVAVDDVVVVRLGQRAGEVFDNSERLREGRASGPQCDRRGAYPGSGA